MPAASTSSTTPAKILIADDHAQGAELLEAYLADQPYDIRVAANGLETLQAIEEWTPDLILLDVMMPWLSGFEVCQRLRANPATRTTGVIMITALDQPADVDRGVEAGTDDFLTKPIQQDDLLVRIRALLQHRRETNDLERTLKYIHAVENPAI